MERKDYYKYLFLIAAIINCGLGILFLVLTTLFPSDIAALYGVVLPPSLVWMHFFLVKAIVIGIGYYFLSVDITKNHGIAKMGLFEKFIFFIVSLVYFIGGAFNILLFILTIVDLVLGFLFIEFLVNYKKI
ncbi:MAG: hypothetical protein ACFFAN_08155 [Promethearchaeota archaeon]